MCDGGGAAAGQQLWQHSKRPPFALCSLFDVALAAVRSIPPARAPVRCRRAGEFVRFARPFLQRQCSPEWPHRASRRATRRPRRYLTLPPTMRRRHCLPLPPPLTAATGSLCFPSPCLAGLRHAGRQALRCYCCLWQ